MRVLMMCSPVVTHLMPMVPLAWALQTSGHAVTLIGAPDLVGGARAGGLPIRLVGDTVDESGTKRRRGIRWAPPRDDEPEPEPPWNRLGDGWRRRTHQALPQAREVAATVRPDLVVADPLEFPALVLGGLLGVPVVQHRWGCDAWSLRVQEPAREQLAGLCRDLGLPDGLPRAAAMIDVRPPSLRPGGPTGLPMRPVTSNGSGEVPRWVLGARPPRRICVTMGLRILDLGAIPLLRRVLAACAGIPGTQVVLPMPEKWREALWPLPHGVDLIDPVPLEELLRTCDLVVHHAGSGTGNTAVVLGVPQVVMPIDIFGLDLAASVRRAGIGTSLDGAAQEDADAIRDAVLTVLDDPAYTRRAAEVAAEVAAMPSPAAVTGQLEELAGRFTQRAGLSVASSSS